MLGEVLVWGLKWYFLALEHWNVMCKVLGIKFKAAKLQRDEISSEIKGHLTVRLNDTCIADRTGLCDLLRYVHDVFRVKYLTVISGNCGFERELEMRTLDDRASIYYNYELVKNGNEISVNFVDCDSENLFLLNIKEKNDKLTDESCEAIYNATLKSFTSTERISELLLKSYVDFPPIDLFICMTRNYNFTRLFPFHLSFTQFYSCPVLADQPFSREAITEGFEKFSKTKQNFGR